MNMDKETKEWARKRMFYEKHGKETFEEAKMYWLYTKGYETSNWIKRLWLLWSLTFNGSLIMAEIKPIQDAMIDFKIEEATHTKASTSPLNSNRTKVL